MQNIYNMDSDKFINENNARKFSRCYDLLNTVRDCSESLLLYCDNDCTVTTLMLDAAGVPWTAKQNTNLKGNYKEIEITINFRVKLW